MFLVRVLFEACEPSVIYRRSVRSWREVMNLAWHTGALHSTDVYLCETGSFESEFGFSECGFFGLQELGCRCSIAVV